MSPSEGMGLRRVVIVDPSTARRAHTRELLARRLGMRVVHEASVLGDLSAHLPEVGRAGSAQLLLVIASTGDTAPRVLAACRAAGLRVVALVADAREATARTLMDAGVEGIVSVRESEGVVLSVIEAVRRGGRAWSPRVRAVLDALPPRPALSAQESRVVALYAAGHTIGEVAIRLGVREDTARKYLNRVKAKYAALGRPVRTKTALAREARVDGWLDAPDGNA